MLDDIEFDALWRAKEVEEGVVSGKRGVLVVNDIGA